MYSKHKVKKLKIIIIYNPYKMLTKNFIHSLTVPQLRYEILARGGHLSVRAKAFKYLRYYLWILRDVEPVVPIIKK